MDLLGGSAPMGRPNETDPLMQGQIQGDATQLEASLSSVARGGGDVEPEEYY